MTRSRTWLTNGKLRAVGLFYSTFCDSFGFLIFVHHLFSFSSVFQYRISGIKLLDNTHSLLSASFALKFSLYTSHLLLLPISLVSYLHSLNSVQCNNCFSCTSTHFHFLALGSMKRSSSSPPWGTCWPLYSRYGCLWTWTYGMMYDVRRPRAFYWRVKLVFKEGAMIELSIS